MTKEEFNRQFSEADKTAHPVETQWHYKTMTDAGFEAVTKEQIGFVRQYDYRRGDRVIRCSTGASANYWIDINTDALGYSRGLKNYLESIK